MAHRFDVQSERGLPLVLPRTPDEYDPRFMSEIVRILDTWARREENPGPIRATYLFCDDRFPRNGNHLEEGAVFIDGDILKVVLPDSGYAPSFVLATGLGDVTVAIS